MLMNFSPLLRVPEHERLKLALVVSPFAIVFLVIGVICGIDYLHEIRFRGPRWVIPVAILTAVHLASSSLVYLALWHRYRSHTSVQGWALLITFLVVALLAVAF